MKKLSLMSVCCCLVHAAVAFYNPQMGRWMTRDPIEEKGGNNLYAFCENAPTYKYDPLGKDVYLYQGNDSGNLINDSIHQSVAVDLWSDDCPPRKIGMTSFSFGYNGEWKWNWPSSTWLGFDSFTLPGFVMVGEIEEVNVVGRQVKKKSTTPCQDREWLKKMREKVGTTDVYSVGRHNCRNFAQREFDAVPANGR